MTDAEAVTALETLQFHWGGLFDSVPADDYTVHLLRSTRTGTPGPSLCGINRFGADAPGFSAGGGITGPNIVHRACAGCADVARAEFPGLPVTGSIGAQVMRAALAEETAR
jgi:hypothetical protein